MHRGFATVTAKDAVTAEALISKGNGRTMTTSSARGGRALSVRVDDSGEWDYAYCRGLRGAKPKTKEVKKEKRKRWTMAECEKLPMRAKCLSTHTRFSDLDGTMRVRLLEYFTTAVPGMSELAGIVLDMEKTHPYFLRVKELLESVEAFALVLAFLNSAESMGGQYEKFFDLACGHGLVGIMIAYAFPNRTVRSFDHARRESFYAFARAFADARGSRDNFNVETSINWDKEATFTPVDRLNTEDEVKEAPWTMDNDAEPALPNLKFTLGDIEAAKPFVDRNSFVVALHGCNEANKTSVQLAREAHAAWLVMPCCIKASLYLPDAVISKLDDDSKFAFLCGVMASQYDAQFIRAIDRRITTRAIVLCGGIEHYVKHCFVIGNTTKIQRDRDRAALYKIPKLSP
jgi:SAM-dependent methyltransferase